jgi:transposase InsO family protein
MPRASCSCAKPWNQPAKTLLSRPSRLFAERGLPIAIRSDNGVPFASPNALFNLSKLSVWWLRLGIAIERIKPGHPQQNGRHERMHLTLKREATRPPGTNRLQQQDRFDVSDLRTRKQTPIGPRARPFPKWQQAAIRV